MIKSLYNQSDQQVISNTSDSIVEDNDVQDIKQKSLHKKTKK